MTIEKIMAKDIVTVNKDQTVIDALKLMQKHKISRLPAISPKTKELVGIITEADMAIKIASAKYEEVPLTHMRISTIMTSDVITAAPSDSKLQVLKKMVDNHIGGIPIVDDGQIVGMITKTDFLKDLTDDVYTETSIKDILTKRVVTIGPDERFVQDRKSVV